MPGQGRPPRRIANLTRTFCLLLTASCLLPPVYATEPTPIQDDAHLHDVQFVGTQTGWAVGDHGVIRHTTDGGRSWTLQDSPVDCPLRSLCVLTDRIGWIVGGGITPYTRIGYGVVLYTENGGKTWTQLSGPANRQATKIPQTRIQSSSTLPMLMFVKFFGPDEGIAVGESSVEFPTGVMITKDSGKTWEAVAGNLETGWRAADFLNIKDGVTAGLRGKVALVGNGRLLPPRIDNIGLRGLWDLKLEPDRSGWLVGDGGLVRRTSNAGVVWQSPSTLLPKDVRDITDFRAVETRKQKAWIAGSPGSIIWHTPDDGRSWVKQRTGQPLPISALHFSTDQLGWAVGAMGTILRTENGGQTWKIVLGKGRRAALMTIHSRSQTVSFHLLAKQSAEQGYRSVVLLPVRRDIGSNGHSDRDLDLRLHEAVTSVGGSFAHIDWRLPVDLPGLDRNYKRLLDEWNRRTEGRLSQVFLGKLVVNLRTWRPSLLVLDQAAPDDAATQLLNEAVLQAVKQAADPTFYIHHNELAGLESWEVVKVYQRLPSQSTGHAHVDLHEYLPRLQKSVQMAASSSYGKLAMLPPQSIKREAYKLLFDRTQQPGSRVVNRDFFISVPILPGSAARRRLPAIDFDNNERQLKLFRKQRNIQAIAERSVGSKSQGAELIAHLRPMTREMSPEQASVQLMKLANDYQQRALWELTEATLIELVNQYPNEPVAWDAMRRLLQLWTGTETAYQRVKRTRVLQSKSSFDAARLIERINNKIKKGPTNPNGIGLLSSERSVDPIEFAIREGRLKTGRDADWRSGTVRHWHDQALKMAALIRRKNPALFRSPEVQFPLASLLRQRGAHNAADRFYRRFQGSGMNDPWRLTAVTEIWLNSPVNLPPKKIVTCKSTPERPVLDGVFGDDCWQNADAIWLTEANSGAQQPAPSKRNDRKQPNQIEDLETQQNRAFAMLAYDREYLYFAFSVPRDPQAPDDRPVLAGRTHDADLLNFDRVGLYLDVDRDYATYYSLQVDQRGRTADACWHDTSWNPKWHVFVSADADNKRWRIEAAIPLKELVPVAPIPGDVWAAGVIRTVPAVRLESWTHPTSSNPRPESFGLIRFQ